MSVLYDNKYEYLKDLGQGGFGKVFLAREHVSNRQVAIKQLISTNKSDQIELIREIEIVSRFRHPNIVTYYHHFWMGKILFLVMEYCPGGSLRDKINSQVIDPNDVINWMHLLAMCMRVVHKNGIVHHDIKPENILFGDQGTIKISDFGIANLGGGTLSYMSPEALSWNQKNKPDSKKDIYALGVTMMELLIGENPFSFLSGEQIIAFHQRGDYPIKDLPNWQQEIILKSINKSPELRFQYMVELEEALNAKKVPVIIKREALKAARLVDHVEGALRAKKWQNAFKYLELANSKYPNNVAILQAFGRYHLMMQNIPEAKKCIEKALRMNPRLDLQKDLGWINLEIKKYPMAISLLSDHLHRHPSDYEAYNLLLRCYYETDRFETAMELAEILMDSNHKSICFANNYYVCSALLHLGQVILPGTKSKAQTNPFLEYNVSVVQEDQQTHNLDKSPTLKSKLLFMDYHFNTIAPNTFTFLDSNHHEAPLDSYNKTIIKIGREGYQANDVPVPKGSNISRRHCVIVNSKDDVWLYDLGSTGTYLNGERIMVKAPLLGMNRLKIGSVEYTITTDQSKLL